MIDIQDVKTLKLGPGQLLVVQVDGIISTEMKRRIEQTFADDAPALADRLLVIDKSVTLAVVDAQAA